MLEMVSKECCIQGSVPISLHAFNETQARELILVESKQRNLSLTDEDIEKMLQHPTGRLLLAIVRTLVEVSNFFFFAAKSEIIELRAT